MLTEVEKGRSEPALIRTECANPCKPSVLSESAIEFNASVESPPAETPEHGPVYIEQDQAVSSEGQKAEVLIVGGGVIGLTIAHALLQHGYRVTLVGRDLSDDHSSGFASPWAGAVWHPFEDKRTARESEWEGLTFRTWLAMKGLGDQPCKPSNEANTIALPMADDHLLALVKMHRVILGTEHADAQTDWQMPWWKDVVLDFKSTANRQECRTFTVLPSAYMKMLFESCHRCPRFAVKRATVTSLQQAKSTFAPNAAMIVNATGLGAATLSDVCDELVEPIRGQAVVLARSVRQETSMPCRNDVHCLFIDCVPLLHGQHAVPDWQPLYVIPRALSGQILLGGTAEVGSYSVQPDQKQVERIVQGAMQHHPRLAQLADEYRSGRVDVREDGEEQIKGCPARKEASKLGLPVLSVGPGLRPSRRGGPRLEVESRQDGLTVVHAYGFGKAGFQSSWGVAYETVNLIQSHLNSTRQPSDQS